MKKILLVADYRNWAWDIKSNNISKYVLEYGYSVEIKYYYDYHIDHESKWHDKGYSENHKINFDKFDFILFFSMKLAKGFENQFSYNNSYVGICSHMKYNGNPQNIDDIRYLNKFRGVFVLNKFLFDLFSNEIKNLYYCPNGIDTNLFYPYKKFESKRKLTIGWVGNNNHACEKGYKEYILPLKQRGLHVLTILKSNKIIPYKKMPDFYNNIDLYLCVSKTEGTPNPALEAAACGKPILSTNVGNMPEFIIQGWNGYIIERNQNEILEKITYLKNNRCVLKQLGVNARIQSLNWSWENQIINYVNMLGDNNV
jgi:glycosyltransferase involved in cell wall biosynthesis